MKDLSLGDSLSRSSLSLFLSYLGQFHGFPNHHGTSIFIEIELLLIILDRWLIAHGRTKEATQILACIEDKPTTSPIVTAQLHEIQYSVDYERSHTIKWKDILLRRNKDTSDTKTLRRLLLGANTQLMQQVRQPIPREPWFLHRYMTDQ